MKSRQPVIAVFDIGKTNKKLLVFDTQYQVVREEVVSFPETTDEDGFPCEDIDELTRWILGHVDALKSSDAFELKAINFSTYGASLVYLDKQGNRIAPLYNYLKPYPPELLEQFNSTYGGGGNISVETSSPIMGHLNVGLQLYWLKHHRPAVFEKVASALHFPQYLSALLTGEITSEMTNVGCHTAMWNFREKKYHDWLRTEGLDSKLLPVISGKKAFDITAGDRTIAVGVGLHDSSAAIIPYLMSFTEAFVIVSTGTWSISLNPFNNELSDLQELSNGSLSYLTYEGNPVKVSRLFAGHDHDQQVKRIASHFNLEPAYFKQVAYDQQWVDRIASEPNDERIMSMKHRNDSATGSCVFHLRDIASFQSAELAYHRLVLDIVERQAIATSVVIKARPVRNMYVDGGFSKNSIYMQLLKKALAGMQVYSSSMVQGTALGAALAIHQSWNPEPLPAKLVHLKPW